MKKLSKKNKRRLLLLALIVIIVLFSALMRQQGGGLLDAGSEGTLVTLPPQQDHAQNDADPDQNSSLQPEGLTEIGYSEDYPESITYDNGGTVDEYGTYSSTEDVAYYLHVYGHLPDNYITKAEAEKEGWDSQRGNLWDVAYGASIGGDYFGNYEGRLPQGERYYECDVNYEGGYRGAERLIFTEDGDVYYTADHYETFVKLY